MSGVPDVGDVGWLERRHMNPTERRSDGPDSDERLDLINGRAASGFAGQADVVGIDLLTIAPSDDHRQNGLAAADRTSDRSRVVLHSAHTPLLHQHAPPAVRSARRSFDRSPNLVWSGAFLHRNCGCTCECATPVSLRRMPAVWPLGSSGFAVRPPRTQIMDLVAPEPQFSVGTKLTTIPMRNVVYP